MKKPTFWRCIVAMFMAAASWGLTGAASAQPVDITASISRPDVLECRGPAELTITPQGSLNIPGSNIIRFKGSGRKPDGTLPFSSLDFFKVTLEQQADLVIVRAIALFGLAAPIIGPFTCFDAPIPITATNKEIRYEIEIFNDNSTTPFLKGQTSLALSGAAPITPPVPTLSIWAMLLIFAGALLMGVKHLRGQSQKLLGIVIAATAMVIFAPPPALCAG
jgi:hypothetical protein